MNLDSRETLLLAQESIDDHHMEVGVQETKEPATKETEKSTRITAR